MPDESEVRGLLALCLATDARRAARYDATARTSRWRITTARSTTPQRPPRPTSSVRGTLAQGPGAVRVPGRDLVACTRSLRARPSTDWAQIAALYGLLANADPSPVVALNRAIAVSYADDPEAALPLLAALEARLADYPPFHAAAADVCRRAGRAEAARAAYARAIALTGIRGARVPRAPVARLA